MTTDYYFTVHVVNDDGEQQQLCEWKPTGPTVQHTWYADGTETINELD